MRYLTPVPESQDLENDGSLITLIAAGDVKAFARLMKRHQNKIHCFAFKYVRDHETAKEIVQETFARVFQNAKQYNPSYTATTWLFNITLNLCRDLARYQRRGPWFLQRCSPADIFYEHDINHINNVPDPSDNVESLMEKMKEKLRAIEEAIDTLPHDLKAALILFYLEECSQDQCAKTLGITVKSMEMRIYRARKYLLKKIGNLVEG